MVRRGAIYPPMWGRLASRRAWSAICQPYSSPSLANRQTQGAVNGEPSLRQAGYGGVCPIERLESVILRGLAEWICRSLCKPMRELVRQAIVIVCCLGL